MAQQLGVQVKYDEQPAEQQAEKLQQAQELVVAKTLPLRVNLPKRGVHCSFAQDVQTEAQKAMTIRFDVAEAKAVGAPMAVVLGLAILWLLAAAAISHKRS